MRYLTLIKGLMVTHIDMVTCSHYKPRLGGLALACNPPSQAKSPISAGFWPGLAWEFRAWPGGLQGLRPGQQITSLKEYPHPHGLVASGLHTRIVFGFAWREV